MTNGDLFACMCLTLSDCLTELSRIVEFLLMVLLVVFQVFVRRGKPGKCEYESEGEAFALLLQHGAEISDAWEFIYIFWYIIQRRGNSEARQGGGGKKPSGEQKSLSGGRTMMRRTISDIYNISDIFNIRTNFVLI